MKGLKLPDEIEIKDEKSYNIKNKIPDISDKYQKFFEYIANKEKENIDHEILSSKVDDINFYDRYNTLYNYLNYFFKSSAEEISLKINHF